MTIRIDTIDLDYLGTPGTIAAYLVRGDGAPVLVEAGPANTREALDRGLAALGVAVHDIAHVLVTHIHFDHAGSAGHLARHGATVHVHAFGAPHLVDPSRLMASAERIYGDRLEPLWGRLVPVPENQVRPIDDGDVIEVEGVRFVAMETPGHARHHHAFILDTARERVAFTGDVASTAIPEAPTYTSPPTPPPEFDLEAWLVSLDRLSAERFDAVYPTHFGRVDDVEGQLDRARDAITRHAHRIQDLLASGMTEDEQRAAYRDWYYEEAALAGLKPGSGAFGFFVKDTMAAMNYTGIARYWTKRSTAPAPA